jgi:hypothetical protein
MAKRGCTFERNVIVVNYPSTMSAGSDLGLLMYETANNTFTDNRWRFFNNFRDGEFAIGWRTGTQGNAVTRDTTCDEGTKRSRMAISGDSQVDSMWFTNCYIKVGDRWNVRWNPDRWRFIGCVLICKNPTGHNDGPGASMFEPNDGSTNWVMEHNTILYYRNAPNNSAGSGNVSIFAAAASTSSLRFYNNVVAVFSDASTDNCGYRKVIIPNASSTRWDMNLYYNFTFPTNTQVLQVTSSTCANVGAFGSGVDDSSAYGNPLFGSTAFGQAIDQPDLRPQPGSPALNPSWPDGYVGAYGPQEAAADSFSVFPQFPSAASRIPVVLAWAPSANGADTSLFIRVYNKAPASISPGGEPAWWDSARVFGDYPTHYRGFHDGYIVTGPTDSIGWSNRLELQPNWPSGFVSDGSLPAQDLWFGARYYVGGVPSPIIYAYADLDSQITVYESPTPPAGGYNVGVNQPTGTYFWWYKPQDVTSYDVRYIDTAVIDESNWDWAIRHFTIPDIPSDSEQPPGTIHYVRIAPACGPSFYSFGVTYTTGSWTSRVGGVQADRGFSCPGAQ